MRKKEVVIFSQDTDWGEKYEKKALSRGFANYLFKQGKILFASEENLAKLEKELVQAEQARLLARQKAQELSQKINELTLSFTLAKNEKGEPLGSISLKKILEELDKSQIPLEKNHFPNFHSLHQLGENIIKVKLGSNIKANLKIVID